MKFSDKEKHTEIWTKNEFLKQVKKHISTRQGIIASEFSGIILNSFIIQGEFFIIQNNQQG